MTGNGAGGRQAVDSRVRVAPEPGGALRLLLDRLDLIAENLAAVDRRLALIESERPAPDDLLTAGELAQRLGVSRAYVYDHADDLGAIRLGDGPKARLRFPPDTANAREPSERPQPAETPARKPTPTTGARAGAGRASRSRPFPPIAAPKEPRRAAQS